jgi:hypothetical protein
MAKYFFTSITRISNLRDVPFLVDPIPRELWQTGDYVVGEVIDRPSMLTRIELSTGRTSEVMEGSFIIGAFGRREATLESNGDWREIEDNMHMHALGSGGTMGKLTSSSPYLPEPLALMYKGHVLLDDRKVNMADYVPDDIERYQGRYSKPSVLIVGTSMSAGKTTAARIVIRELKEMGLTVTGLKLTGAGRFRDILGMRDAGADHILDFVDVGLPTTVCEPERYRRACRVLLAMVTRADDDVVVIETGASPLEPYNGSIALAEVEQSVRFTVLCASDPYAVVGLLQAYSDLRPDVVAGAAANTAAAVRMVEKLTGLTAVNLLDRESSWRLRELLRRKLGIARRTASIGSYDNFVAAQAMEEDE